MTWELEPFAEGLAALEAAASCCSLTSLLSSALLHSMAIFDGWTDEDEAKDTCCLPCLGETEQLEPVDDGDRPW